MLEIVGTNERTVIPQSEDQDCVPLDRLVVRGRGFWETIISPFLLMSCIVS